MGRHSAGAVQLDDPSDYSPELSHEVKCFVCKCFIELEQISTHSRSCSAKNKHFPASEEKRLTEHIERLKSEWHKEKESLLKSHEDETQQIRTEVEVVEKRYEASVAVVTARAEDLQRKLESAMKENSTLAADLQRVKRTHDELNQSIEMEAEKSKEGEEKVLSLQERNELLEKQINEMNLELSHLRQSANERRAEEESAVVLQSLVRKSAAAKLFHNIKHRHKITSELLATEQSYVNSIEILLKIWMRPLQLEAQKPNGFISSEDVVTLFSNLEDIFSCNKELCAELSTSISQWNCETSIGEIFIRKLPSLHHYVDYITNYSEATAVLNQHKGKREEFAAFLEQCSLNPETHYGVFEDFLILPVQRIPRYIMLLEALAKKTDAQHSDHASLHEAISKLKEFTEYINDCKRRREEIAHVTQITGVQIVNSSSTTLIKEGIFEDAEKKKRYCFLFSDLVLYSREAKTSGKNWDLEKSKWKKLEFTMSAAGPSQSPSRSTSD
eukprot:TRINITY_DN11694_c0_g1_i1.p1 TRINITY_DN11694_c0_g1~~TRINITY_DN11694_c0_g1_i1.p1  ORF type:complete len:500 (-),score=103.91 TRINITY_DN11694_c0_g1_i1:8-1507(-)